MRKAIAAAANDPQLVAEAASIKMDMTYTPPSHLEEVVAKLYATPSRLMDTIKDILPNER